MSSEQNLEALSRPFSDDEVEWRIDRGGEKDNGDIWAMVVPYADARAVMKRLDEAVGIANWRAEYEPVTVGTQEGMKCHLFLRLNGEWVDKCDVAGLRPRETGKAAFIDALKRAAVHWGVARDLYDVQGPIFANVGKKGLYYGRINVKKRKNDPDKWVNIRWSPPKLDDVRKHRQDEPEPEEPEAKMKSDTPILKDDAMKKKLREYAKNTDLSDKARKWCEQVLSGEKDLSLKTIQFGLDKLTATLKAPDNEMASKADIEKLKSLVKEHGDADPDTADEACAILDGSTKPYRDAVVRCIQRLELAAKGQAVDA